MQHILIIEDDGVIARIEKDYLKMSGFRVTLAEDGETGLRAALQQPFDLILLDVMLPRMDGFTVLQQLRSRLDVPILLVTARTEDLDKIQGLGLGADDYIEKPFSPGVLVARVRANLAQYARLKQGDKNRLLQFGALKLDTGARRVFSGEQEVLLKNKEYELLLLFLRNRNIALFRDKIYERVWEGEYLADSRTVDLHVQRLRRKLGWQKRLIAIYKVGYRLEV